MPVPSLALSPVQRQLLGELDLTDLPAPDAGVASWAARGLDADDVRDALPGLTWAGAVARTGDSGATLTLTPLGAAALYAAQCDELTARLSAVVSFADTVGRGAASPPAALALKRLAEGDWTLAEAETHVRSDGTQSGTEPSLL